MGKLAIKIQKARRMVQKNGLLSGGKIVAGYGKDYLKSFFVGSGDILFVTGGIGDKAHFRAFGVAEELNLHGFKCAVTVADNFRLLKFANKFKIFVLHKVSYNGKIARFIEEIKKQNKEIIFDTDDLDYDPKYLAYMDYFSQITPAEKAEYEKGIGAEIVNDPYIKLCTTTVSYLAQKLKEKNKQVFIVSNKVSNRELEIANRILEKEKLGDGFLRIGYYSGTLSHNKDFATVSEVLMEILEKNKKVKLLLAGLLDIENKLNKFRDRIEILPRVPRDEFYANVYKCDINIVPLEIGNPFCESRSAIKFMGAGVLKIPTVAVGNQTFSEAIIDGQDGFLARTHDEWVEKISRLIENEELRKNMGQKAREKVLRDYTVKNSHSEEYYAYLRSRLKLLSKR
jgi:glycosyltransferase involved in cell wall biosynthesis